MKMKMTVEQIEKLAEGFQPHEVNPEWDCAMVIEYLSKLWLKMSRDYYKTKDILEVTQALINDVY